MRKTILTLCAATMTLSGIALSAPAMARDGYRYREWRGDDGRMYCRKSDGTTGLVIGAAGGALLGRAVDTHGSRATGTILGAAAGALVGREIDRKRRCR